MTATQGAGERRAKAGLAPLLMGGFPAAVAAAAWISGLAALSTGVALVVLCIEVDENPATRSLLWILVGMVAVSFALEALYRLITGRKAAATKPADR